MTSAERESFLKRAEGLITQAQSLIDTLHEDAVAAAAALGGSATFVDTPKRRWTVTAEALGSLSDMLDDARTACADVAYEPPVQPQGASPLAFLITDPKLKKSTRKKLIDAFDKRR